MLNEIRDLHTNGSTTLTRKMSNLDSSFSSARLKTEFFFHTVVAAKVIAPQKIAKRKSDVGRVD
jgi:hypothetical protein